MVYRVCVCVRVCVRERERERKREREREGVRERASERGRQRERQRQRECDGDVPLLLVIILPPASCLLPPTSCLLPPASCLLPPSSCLQPPASFLLPPSSYGSIRSAIPPEPRRTWTGPEACDVLHRTRAWKTFRRHSVWMGVAGWRGIIRFSFIRCGWRGWLRFVCMGQCLVYV